MPIRGPNPTPIDTLGSEHPEVAFALNNLASLYQTQGRYAEALTLVRSAAQIGFPRKSVYLAVVTGAAETSLLGSADALNEGFQVVQRENLTAVSRTINQLSARYAAENRELAQFVRTDQDLAAEIERLDRLIIEAVSKEPSRRDALGEQQIRDRLRALGVERTRIETALRQGFPAYAELAKPQPLSVQETQGLLEKDEVLIVFDFDKRSYAGIFTQSEAAGVDLKITAKDLEDQVKAVRSSLTSEGDTQPFDVDAAYKLYQMLFGEFAEHIASKSRLFVVSNGALTSLPLHLLITKPPSNKSLRGVDWFLRSYAITNLPSVTSLKALREQRRDDPSRKPFIAFADPVFSKQSREQALATQKLLIVARGAGGYLVQLPGTRREVESIAAALQIDPSDIKFGLDATETTVKTAKLEDYRIVYFATHGLVAGDPEKYETAKVEPALALSIPDKAGQVDDGFLSASEVAQLKLNAEWVVLSGCNTAAGDKPGGEALSGLARAFFYAGARSLLVSHWEVEDDVTARLMTKIFLATKQNSKLSHGEALRQAMLSIIEEASSEEDLHPRWWAPFVVVGEPRRSN